MITNKQAVEFTNLQVRVFAHVALSAYKTAKELIANYDGKAQDGLGQTFTSAMAEVVDDGADKDGRPIATGNDVLTVIQEANQLIADMEGSNFARLRKLQTVAYGETMIGR
jgi:hypothetical protein